MATDEQSKGQPGDITETIGLPTRPPRPVEPAPQIPDYRVVKVIGRGAFGTVWLAEEPMAGLFRAIKVLHTSARSGEDPERAKTPGPAPLDKRAAADRIDRELAGIHAYQTQVKDHPHLVRILKTGLCTLAAPGAPDTPNRAATVRERSTSEELRELSAHPPAKAGGSSNEPAGARIPSRTRKQAVYYVMEIADHAAGAQPHRPNDYEPLTLAIRLKGDRRLASRQVTEYAGNLLDAIDHLHKAGLHHRDVKPANCLFVGGALKLADMGLTASDSSTETVGTPGYLPPAPPDSRSPAPTASRPPKPTHSDPGASPASSRKSTTGTTLAKGEQSDGSPPAPRFGRPDDLYALGKIIYEMTTGLKAAAFPEWPADLDPASDPLLPPLRALVNHLCQPNPAKRLSSICETRRRLTGLGSSRKEIRISRRKASALLGLFVIVGIVAGGWGVKWWYDRYDPTKHPVGLEEYDGTEGGQFRTYDDTRVHMVRRHLSGEVYDISDGTDTVVRFYDVQTWLADGGLIVAGTYQIYLLEQTAVSGDVTLNDGPIHQISLIAGDGPDAVLVTLLHTQPGKKPGIRGRFTRGIPIENITITTSNEQYTPVYLSWSPHYTSRSAEEKWRNGVLCGFHTLEIARLQMVPSETAALRPDTEGQQP